jgi:hypothetical protein
MSRGVFTHERLFGIRYGCKIGRASNPRSASQPLFKLLQSDSDPKNGIKSTLSSTVAVGFVKATNSSLFALTSAMPFS